MDLRRKDVLSVYALGVFGGVASSCCAPVLAGVLVLTVLSGTWLAALVVGLAYVLGMVFLLFAGAAVWDQRAGAGPRIFRGRLVQLRFLGYDFEIHPSKLVAGVLFLAMGAFTIVLGVVDRMLVTPGSDLLGIYQSSIERTLVGAFSNAGTASAIGVVTIVSLFLISMGFRRSRLRSSTAAVRSKSMGV